MHMLRFTKDPGYLQYSPLALGFTGTFSIYLGTALISVFKQTIPSWLWFLAILPLAIGLFLQLNSKRILWIRTYQVFIGLINACVWSSLLWFILTRNQTEGTNLFTGITIGVLLVASVLGIYLRNINSTYLSNMPYGPQGVLNTKTGIVDPTRSPTFIHRRQEPVKRRLDVLWRFSPLIAGFSMFLVRVLSESANTIILALVTLLWIIVCAGGAGGAIAYVISILRWEQEHEKRMYVNK
jgi:hypothetical protein